MGLGTIVVGQLPRVLKHLVVPVFKVPFWYYRMRTLSTLIQEMERRLKAGEDASIDIESRHDSYDLFQQCVEI
ncbi:putative cytochrome p450 protein [Seiridium cardinale]